MEVGDIAINVKILQIVNVPRNKIILQLVGIDFCDSNFFKL
jgi:hypothetical protein